MSSEHALRLQELIELACDGTIDAEATGELEALLTGNRAAQDEYLRWMHLASNLMLEAEALAEGTILQSSPADDDVAAELPPGLASAAWDVAKRPMTLSVVVAGLTLSIILLTMALLTSPVHHQRGGQSLPTPDYAAQLVAQHECVWGGEDADSFANAAEASDLRAGQLLQLRSGVARIVFDSGARTLLEGPAELRIVHDNRGQLLAGKLAAFVPSAADGFAVETPLAVVVDLGTEFGIDVRPTETDLHVYQGAVDVRASELPAPRRLTTGQALRLSRATGKLAASDTEYRPHSIRRVLPGEPVLPVAVALDLSPYFNADVIINGGPGLGDALDREQDAVDSGDYAFATRNALAALGETTLFGLPDGGELRPTVHHPFQWQVPWDNEDDGPNAISVRESGTQVIEVAPQAFRALHLLATSGSGATELRITLEYEVGEPQTTEFVIPDWGSYPENGSSVYVAFDQLARLHRDDLSAGDYQWKMYGVPVVADPQRKLKRITLDMEGGTFSLFGIAGLAVDSTIKDSK